MLQILNSLGNLQVFTKKFQLTRNTNTKVFFVIFMTNKYMHKLGKRFKKSQFLKWLNSKSFLAFYIFSDLSSRENKRQHQCWKYSSILCKYFHFLQSLTIFLLKNTVLKENWELAKSVQWNHFFIILAKMYALALA